MDRGRGRRSVSTTTAAAIPATSAVATTGISTAAVPTTALTAVPRIPCVDPPRAEMRVEETRRVHQGTRTVVMRSAPSRLRPWMPLRSSQDESADECDGDEEDEDFHACDGIVAARRDGTVELRLCAGPCAQSSREVVGTLVAQAARGRENAVCLSHVSATESTRGHSHGARGHSHGEGRTSLFFQPRTHRRTCCCAREEEEFAHGNAPGAYFHRRSSSSHHHRHHHGPRLPASCNVARRDSTSTSTAPHCARSTSASTTGR